MSRELTLARQMIWADLLRLRKKRGFMALVRLPRWPLNFGDGDPGVIVTQ